MARTTRGLTETALAAGTDRLQGRDARENTVSAGRSVAALVRTTLGPKGMDKMLLRDGEIVVTNDGASILDRIEVEHPAAKLVVEVADAQGSGPGDGTTTAVVLAGELLGAAEGLFDDGVHPNRVARGYRFAIRRAVDHLDDLAVDAGDDRELLETVARTAITGRWDARSRDLIASLAVDASRAVARGSAVAREDLIRKPVPGGELAASELVSGLVVDLDSSSTTPVTPDPRLPARIEEPTLALVDDQLTVPEPDAVSTASVSGHDALQSFVDREKRHVRKTVDRFDSLGVDVVFCQKSVDDRLRLRLAEQGIRAVERTRQDELNNLARATGGAPVRQVDELDAGATGRAGLIEHRSVGGTDHLVVSECVDSDPHSVVLRGGPPHVVDELERVFEDCLDVIEPVFGGGGVVAGGGATEVALARELRAYAADHSGREQLAIRAVADALEAIPRTLASTAGADPIDVISALRARHHEGEHTAGFDARAGGPADLAAAGILEPAAVKRRALTAAQEAACLLVGIDDVIAAGDLGEDETGHNHAGHDHGHAGGHDHDHGTGGYPWAIGH